MLSAVPAVLMAALQLGCLPPTGVAAPYGTKFEWLIDEYKFKGCKETAETDCLNTTLDAQDYKGQLLEIGGVVFDEEDDRPVAGIQVTAQVLGAGVYLIPDTALRTVDPPTFPEGADKNGDGLLSDKEVTDECCVDQDPECALGRVVDEPGSEEHEWCAWYLPSADGGLYLQFGDDYFEAEAGGGTYGGYGPNYWIGQSDTNGMVRLYAFVDYFVGGSSSGGAALIIGSVGVALDDLKISLES